MGLMRHEIVGDDTFKGTTSEYATVTATKKVLLVSADTIHDTARSRTLRWNVIQIKD